MFFESGTGIVFDDPFDGDCSALSDAEIAGIGVRRSSLYEVEISANRRRIGSVVVRHCCCGYNSGLTDGSLA
jgi:hypothetical protein